jgi:glutamate racemase
MAKRHKLREIHAQLSMTTALVATPHIGVFDSGVGGLSVLKALRRQLPATTITYLGDVAYAPYGERPAAEVLQRCERIVQQLVDWGARLIVVACNTATVLGVNHLRQRWPSVVFVGVEPGVKPAATASRTKRIAVMATPATARSARLQWLIDHHAQGVHVHVQPCPGLAGAIECGHLSGAALLDVLAPCCQGVLAAQVDTVVLGCTHYPFVAGSVHALLGIDMKLLDTSAAVAARVASLWRQLNLPFDARPVLRVLSTGSTTAMRLLLQQSSECELPTVEICEI